MSNWGFFIPIFINSAKWQFCGLVACC